MIFCMGPPAGRHGRRREMGGSVKLGHHRSKLLPSGIVLHFQEFGSESAPVALWNTQAAPPFVTCVALDRSCCPRDCGAVPQPCGCQPAALASPPPPHQPGYAQQAIVPS